MTRLRRAGLAPEEGPHAVAAAGSGGLRLVALDGQARALGLRAGELLGRVRARIGGPLHIHPAEPEAERDALHRLCRWAMRYAPIVAPFGPAEGGHGFYIDIEGASHLHGGEVALLDDLAGRLAKARIPARIALADTPGAAFAVARCGTGRHFNTLSPTLIPSVRPGSPKGLSGSLRPCERSEAIQGSATVRTRPAARDCFADARKAGDGGCLSGQPQRRPRVTGGLERGAQNPQRSLAPSFEAADAAPQRLTEKPLIPIPPPHPECLAGKRCIAPRPACGERAEPPLLGAKRGGSRG